MWKGVLVAGENHGVETGRFCYTQESAPNYKDEQMRK